MNKLPIFLLLGLITLTACKQKSAENYKSVPSISEAAKAVTSEPHPGKKLMETQCYLCHSGTAPENEGRIGPPMIAIKAHYINDATTKEEFVDAIWNFVEKPSEENAKLRGAVRRFGVMPYQSFKKEEIAQIAEYIFDYQIDEPEWFKEHWENGHNKKRKPYKNEGKKIASNNNNTIEDIGLNYALDTKKVLGKNLMGAIQEKGTLHALKFCNEQAYPLTDSMAQKFNATIKRVSDKPRNPNNQADETELEMIAHFKKLLAQDETIVPIVEKENGTNHFYYPITTNSMCLQCHGSPNKNIATETLASIQMLYPKDKAVDYDVNEVRGIWSITFDNRTD